MLLEDILTDAGDLSDAEGAGKTTKLLRQIRNKTDLPQALGHCIAEVIEHRNLFVHALKWNDLDGTTYLNDLECVRVVALWYLRDFRNGPRLDVKAAERLLSGAGSGESLPSTSRQLFLSYANEDESQARELYNRLKERGHKPWMDKHDLLPGQEWELEIRRAIQNADFFIALMSRDSVTKKGFVQKEIRYALDVLGEIPPGRIYLIPIRLNACDVPDSIKRLHWIDLQEKEGYSKLCRAIEEGSTPSSRTTRSA